jgi:glycolate oxidase FAD binding subunit
VQTVQTLRKVSRQNGGSTVVLDASKIIKSLLDTWGPVPAIELMKAVKQQFDPERHLAPGRFVGGI